MNANQVGPNKEREVTVMNGWLMLVASFGLLGIALAVFISAGHQPSGQSVGLGAVLLGVLVIMLPGFFTLQPNRRASWCSSEAIRAPCAVAACIGAIRFIRMARRAMQKIATSHDPVTALATVRSLARNKVSPAGSHTQQRALKGERQARQSHRDRRRRGLASPDTAQAMFDVDNYENYVAHAERIGVAPPGEPLLLR